MAQNAGRRERPTFGLHPSAATQPLDVAGSYHGYRVNCYWLQAVNATYYLTRDINAATVCGSNMFVLEQARSTIWSPDLQAYASVMATKRQAGALLLMIRLAQQHLGSRAVHLHSDRTALRVTAGCPYHRSACGAQHFRQLMQRCI
jgi:hypothetical protein